MNVKIENAGGCRRLVDVAVAAQDVHPEYERVTARYAAHASVPGFRPGKAPKERVEARFRKQITKEAQDALLPKAYQEMLKQESLEPVALLDLQEVRLSPEKGLTFRVVLDVAPEFKLPKYHKITLKNESTEVTDADVDEAMKHVLERFSRFEDVTEGCVETGDLVQIDYEGWCDGKALAERGVDGDDLAAGKAFWVPVVDESEFLPGLNAGLTGMAVGGSAEIAIAFPKNHKVKVLAGINAVYHVHVTGLRKLRVPALDEELLKKLDVDTEDAFRARLREDIGTSKAARELARKKEEISAFLLEHTPFDPPQVQVDSETSSLLRSLLTRMTREGATREMMETHRDAITETVAKQAVDRVRIQHILRRIAAEEKIEVSDADVAAAIDGIAQRYHMPPEKMRAEIEKQDDGKSRLRDDVRADKVFSFLLGQARIKG